MDGSPDKSLYREALPAGQCGEVRFARRSNGIEPAWDFWETKMTVRQQASFSTLFRMIINSTTLKIGNGQKFKRVDGDMYEFKCNQHQMRIFCFRSENCWYLTSGLAGKKEDDLPPGEVIRALEIMDDCKAELIRSAKAAHR